MFFVNPKDEEFRNENLLGRRKLPRNKTENTFGNDEVYSKKISF